MSTDAHNQTAATSAMMPAVEQLAAEAISRLVTDGYTSSLMKLARPTLNELARRLVTPGATTDSAIEWLDAEGHAQPKTNVYRFAQRFREVYKEVWGAWADKLILAQLAADPAFDGARLDDVIKNRVRTLIAQEVMTSSPADLDTGRLNAALSLVFAADKGKLEREKLLLSQAQAEHRAMKLEAEVEKLRIENEQRRTAMQRSIDGAKKTIQTASEGGSKPVSADDVIAILDRVMKGEAA